MAVQRFAAGRQRDRWVLTKLLRPTPLGNTCGGGDDDLSLTREARALGRPHEVGRRDRAHALLPEGPRQIMERAAPRRAGRHSKEEAEGQQSIGNQ